MHQIFADLRCSTSVPNSNIAAVGGGNAASIGADADGGELFMSECVPDLFSSHQIPNPRRSIIRSSDAFCSVSANCDESHRTFMQQARAAWSFTCYFIETCTVIRATDDNFLEARIACPTKSSS